MAAALSRVLGTAIGYNNVPPEVYRSFGFPGADDLGNMFQLKRDFNDYFRGVRDLAFTRSLNPELQSFEQWLARHAAFLGRHLAVCAWWRSNPAPTVESRTR